MTLLDLDTHEILEWEIDEQTAGERLDKFVTDAISDGISRSQVQLWIKDSCVKVNGTIAKSNHRLEVGQRVELAVPEVADSVIVAEDITLDIAYEDKDLIVVNKPRGMVVHPAVGHSSGTLVNALMFHCKDLSGINGEMRPGIVHRIDKDTSGLMMAAKNDKAHISLSNQLKEHTVTRKYIAIIHGLLPHDQGTIDAQIGRDPRDRKLFAVNTNIGKRAVTHFRVLERFKDYTMVELQLETGRTHQIRVHMKFIGHPIVGDPVYGRTKGVTMNGQALHAAVLGFVHPTLDTYMEYEAPLPEDMNRVLENLRNM
ncbi:MAG: RluA family pseudouridine synthase [Paenibacillaceae bacterium]